MTTQESIRASDTIETAITAMNACIRRAERDFEALGLGVSATVLFPENGPPRWLRFGKYSNEWILQVQNEDTACSPLLNCDLKTRRAALALFPQLHVALITAARDTASSIKLAVHDATVFLDTLAGK